MARPVECVGLGLGLAERPLPAGFACWARFARLLELASPVERLPRAVFACLSGFLSLVETWLPADWRGFVERALPAELVCLGRAR